MSDHVSIDLKSSLCVDNPTGSDVYPFTADPTQVVQNTGMERAGGITSIYEQETTFATAGLQSLITKSGDLLQVDASHNIRINDTSIGNVGPYAVYQRGQIPGYLDAAWTADGTIIGIVRIGSAIRVDEFDPATGLVTHTRSTTFSMPSISITNVVLIKYIGMHFADSLQFVISNSQMSYLLSESGATIVLVGNVIWTTRTLEGNGWLSVTWSPALGIFCAVGSGTTHYAATSTDGVTWNTRTLAAGIWNSVCWSPSLSLFVAVSENTNYAASSLDGITWNVRTLEANGWKEVCWSSALGIFVAVGGGGTHYAATSVDGVNWNTRILAAGSYQSICWSPEKAKFVAVGSSVAATSSDGTIWSAQTISVNGWTSVCWSPVLSLFVAVGTGGTKYVATSVDGVTWIDRTAPGTAWNGVVWSSLTGLFHAVGNVTNYAMTSPDGINWTVATIEANTWLAMAWSEQLGIFSAVGTGITHYAATGALTAPNVDYVWKYAASKFIMGRQGTAGSWYIGDIAGSPSAITDATWCVTDIFSGTAYSRSILTFAVKKNASNLLTGYGEVGYNNAGTYSATPTYYGVALAAVTVSITNNISGPGYAEATFTRSDSGTNIYYYLAPIMAHNPGVAYDYKQSQTQTLCNGYGKLTDINGNANAQTCSLRSVMINGVPSHLSAGVIASDNIYPTDNLGVPITNVGEFDELYVPHVIDSGTVQQIIYRYNGILFYVDIRSGVTNTLSRVSDNTYLVNCLSPINAIDVAGKQLRVGTNDYNGRMLFNSAGAILGTSAQVVALIQGADANSVDPGAKLNTITFSIASILIPGIGLPSFIDRAIQDFGVNLYYAATGVPVYNATYYSFNVTATNGNLTNVLYVQDTRLPVGMGYTFYDGHTMQTEIETVFMGVGITGSGDIDYDYVCYELGNDTLGQFQSFTLYGQSFLFDGKNVWLASFTGSLFNGKGNQPMAVGTGLSLIAVSPTEAFFLSSFDNSLYSFNGGRSLAKGKRMNDLRNSSNAIESIINGVFNIRDNALLLQTASSFVWVRDGVVTQNQKKANQTAIGLFDTANGIQIANTTTKWVYSFAALSNSTVVPLTWQSAFHSLKANELSVATAWIVTLYSPGGRISAPVTLTCYSFDQENYSTNKGTITIQPSWWDGLGFCRLRAQPKTEKALASSLQIDTNSHLTITDVTVLYGDEAQATIAGARSI